MHELLSANPHVAHDFRIRETAAPGDATTLARDAGAEGFNTVIVIGGDGVIHEAVNGLMAGRGSRADERPQLAIIPLGSGNDYARTLGMARNDVAAAFRQIAHGAARALDLGCVNGTFYAQTLSFGIDAAIAIDTTRRRAAETSQKGAALFATSGLKLMSTARTGFPCRVRFDDEPERRLDSLIFALQIGPSYGGGFRICPDADPSDGLIDVCYNVKLPSIPRTLALFAMARQGRHVRSSAVELRTCRHATIEFEREPPAQADGEELHGTRFDVSVEPAALRVVLPA